MRNDVAHIIAMWILAILLCSCEVKYPEYAGLKNLEVQRFKPLTSELVLSYDLGIYQVNPVPIKLDKIRSRIYFDDLYMGDGMTTHGLRLPPRDTAWVHIEQNLKVKNFLRNIKELPRNGKINFRLDSDIFLIGERENLSIPYSYVREMSVEEELQNLILRR